MTTLTPAEIAAVDLRPAAGSAYEPVGHDGRYIWAEVTRHDLDTTTMRRAKVPYYWVTVWLASTRQEKIITRFRYQPPSRKKGRLPAAWVSTLVRDHLTAGVEL